MTPHRVTADLARLHDEARSFPTDPYLLTVTGDRRPHCTVVHPRWDTEAGRLVVAAPSGWPQSDDAGHTAVTLLWPPADPGGYSLIVDGTAAGLTVGSEPHLAVTPGRAVLHRPERLDRPGAPCRADCVPIIPS